MLLKNIDQSNDFCNGTQLHIRKLENYLVKCKILTEIKIEKITLILKMNMVPNNDCILIKF
ncbi:hypothetical protein AHAS_Ahas04G0141200 [Arachis hypogaea]